MEAQQVRNVGIREVETFTFRNPRTGVLEARSLPVGGTVSYNVPVGADPYRTLRQELKDSYVEHTPEQIAMFEKDLEDLRKHLSDQQIRDKQQSKVPRGVPLLARKFPDIFHKGMAEEHKYMLAGCRTGIEVAKALLPYVMMGENPAQPTSRMITMAGLKSILTSVTYRKRAREKESFTMPDTEVFVQIPHMRNLIVLVKVETEMMEDEDITKIPVTTRALIRGMPLDAGTSDEKQVHWIKRFFFTVKKKPLITA